MMNTPAPITKPTNNNLKENINIINEYKLNIENINYLMKIGKIIKEIEELIIFIKNENNIDQYYYHNTFSLENLQKINKLFRQFETIDESIDALKEIISEKKM